ncbi:hypothetical protein [Halotia branconii]|uniref:Uncharacterized protein n=1 Tax=Halotia branconii CENA392 TaxID=1539056 RepID=A0AAJ6P928_9CYAN|nr:hypothetical protein [Halotia branconii]WGV25305.1 hypothetical protein QI031_26750 [Halotia branconii CENA392]
MVATITMRREVRRRRGWIAHQRIIARSETVKAKTGMQPASTDLIRSLREDEGRREIQIACTI